MEREAVRGVEGMTEQERVEIEREFCKISGQLETEIQLSVKITEEEIRTEEGVEEDKREVVSSEEIHTTETSKQILSKETEIVKDQNVVGWEFFKIFLSHVLYWKSP